MKILKIKLTERECTDLNGFLKNLDTDLKQFVIAARNTLSEHSVIRDGLFWASNKTYAYCNSDKYDKKLTKNSVCEVCGEKYKISQNGYVNLGRHHYNGYANENAFKVIVLCRKHHTEAHTVRGKKSKAGKLEEIIEFYKQHYDKVS